MVSIWEIQQQDELERAISSGFAATVDNLPPTLSIDIAPLVGTMQLERILITGDWGNGTADRGDAIDVLLVISFDESPPVIDPEESDEFPDAREAVSDSLEDGFNERDIGATDFDGLFGEFNFSIVHTSGTRDTLNLRIGRGTGNSVYNLTDRTILRLTENGNVIRQSPDELTQEEPDDGEGQDTDGVEQQVKQAVTEIEQDEQLRRKYPELPDELVSKIDPESEDLEIPIGKKQTKTIERKEPYPFEREMAEPGIVVSTELSGRVEEGIGAAVATNFSGSVPASFPRTGLYIRNRLLFEGPAYMLELYKDLVYYSGYISEKYNYSLRAGTYVSFREYLWRLRQIEKDGGPTLVRAIPESEAQDRGLDTMPAIETSEGEMDAPWLERRSYYEINEKEVNNMDVWTDPTNYLYSVLREE